MKNENKNFYISKRIGYILTFVAGILGVYTYKISGGIFGNGLTGDVLYISINIFNKNIIKALVYLFVIISFTIGVIVGYGFKHYYKNNDMLYKHYILLFESILLIFPLFINSQLCNLFIVSMVFGAQIEVYEYIGKHVFSSVNYVGNTKNAGENLASFIFLHNKSFLFSALKYYLAFISFFCGGLLGSILFEYNIKLLLILSNVLLVFANFYLYFQHIFKKV